MQFITALVFLIKNLSNLYLLLFLLRILLQWVHADFYNPLSQFVFRATNPLVMPIRKYAPASRAVDVPALIVLIALETGFTWLLTSITDMTVSPGVFAYFVVLRLIRLLIFLYIGAIIIYVVLSWIGQSGYNPMARVLNDLVNPALGPVRRFLPPIGGLDLSPLLVLILLQAALLLVQLPPVLA